MKKITTPSVDDRIKTIIDQGKLAVLKPAAIRTALKKSRLEATGSISEQTERLLRHQLENAPNDDALLKCDVCGFCSLEDYDDCPFCEGVDTAPAAEKAKRETAPKPPKEQAPKAEKPKRVKKPAEVVEVVKTEPEAKAVIPKGAKRSKVDAEVIEYAAEVQDEKTLDREIKAIKKALTRGTDALYEVGQRMAIIRDHGLYTLRLDENGKPKYRRLHDFTEAELGMSRPHAQTIMNVVENFAKEDIEQIGVTKLGPIVSLRSAEVRSKLLEKARSGATKSEIKDEIKRLQGGEAERTRNKGFRGTPVESTGKRRRAPEPSAEITIATTEQDVMIPLLTVDGYQAVAYGPGLVGSEVTANGVKVTYTLVVIDGIGVGIRVQRVR